MDACGERFVIVSGDARAEVDEVGGGLAGFVQGGRVRVEPHPPTARPPKGSGAVLAPWPNRVAGGSWSHRGTAHHLPLTEPAAGNAIHGLLRHVPWTLADRAGDHVSLTAVAPVQPGWPQPVRVTVTHTVGAGGLTVETHVENLGDAPVPFGLGFHPYLRVGDVPTDELELTLAARTTLPLDGGIPSGPARPLEREFSSTPLAGLELDDAFGGCAPGDGDELVRHRVAAPDGGGTELWAEPAFGWVQVFTPPDFPRQCPDGAVSASRAVAVEPMTCPPDALNSGTDLIELVPGEQQVLRWGVLATG
ncbi:aldose epimerase [Pseudonocardia sp. EC080610-09]|uniref:aldose 1-epimerase family protein n=1 Tax=unclassified Pseudonocardia TaxID=2619320 RepID=UPI0006CB4200|nr:MULTISPECIES: aldose 1-epimerase family protein [unclassified Pseudonocardia]ALE73410.1 aldose epimerase [Pseudonocardia sp. EC080625-04]ALL77075.1 aldose epimerase [Pseudonocardia sp. EC080610-09]ALL84106.1 aldose epimerase [Pseudonocardia sp. EC080619-01]